MTWNLQSLSEIFPCFTVHPLSTVLPDVLMWQIQSAVILSLQNSQSHLILFLILYHMAY